MGRVRTLLKNISVNFITQSWLFLVSLITTPFIFSHLKEEQFSLLLLFVTISGWFAILDFGILPSFIKHLAEKRETEQDNESLLQTAQTVFFLVIIFWGMIVFLLSPLLIENVFKVSLSLQPLAVRGLQLMTFSFVFTMLASFYSGIPEALQRFEISNLKSIFLGTVIPFGTATLLFFGQGFWQIIWLYLIANFVAFGLFFCISRKLLPGFSYKIKIKKLALKRLFSFASFKFLASLTARISFQLNHFLIAAFMPVANLSFYALPASIGEKALSLLPNLTTPIFPLASELKSLKEEVKLKLLFERAVRLSNLLMVATFCLLFFLGPKFLNLWMGNDFAQKAGLALQVLSLAYLLASFPAVPAAVAEGIGRPQVTAGFGAFNALLTVIFSLIFIPAFGLIGAAWSMLLTRVIQVPVFIFWTSRKIVMIRSFSFYWQSYLKIVLLGFLAGLWLRFALAFINNFWSLAFFSGLYLLLFFVFCVLFGAVKKGDFEIVAKFIRRKQS